VAKPRQLAHGERIMPWKMDGETIAMKDGNPVWVGNDGTEIVADYGHAIGKINELTGESVSRKNKLREYEEKYVKHFEGVDDPASFLSEARKAMEIAKNLDAKKLIDAGEVEKVKGEVSKVYEEKLSAAQMALQEKDAILTKEMIGGRFSRSRFIADKLAIPADLAEAAFGRNFQIKDGKVIAVGHDGREIYSREKPGEVADFDEALSILVDGYANKAAILKGSTASGGGAQGGGGYVPGQKTVTLDQLNAMKPKDRAEFFTKGGTIQG